MLGCVEHLLCHVGFPCRFVSESCFEIMESLAVKGLDARVSSRMTKTIPDKIQVHSNVTIKGKLV